MQNYIETFTVYATQHKFNPKTSIQAVFDFSLFLLNSVATMAVTIELCPLLLQVCQFVFLYWSGRPG